MKEIDPTIYKRSWRDGQRLFGPIKPGQLWKKRDQGKIARITGSKKGTFYTLEYQDGGRETHLTDMRDIYRYYDKL